MQTEELGHPRVEALSADERATANKAVTAIYQDAWRQGYRTGFQAGIAEKAWLHRHWPMILLLACVASLIFGIVIVGVNRG